MKTANSSYVKPVHKTIAKKTEKLTLRLGSLFSVSLLFSIIVFCHRGFAEAATGSVKQLLIRLVTDGSMKCRQGGKQKGELLLGSLCLRIPRLLTLCVSSSWNMGMGGTQRHEDALNRNTAVKECSWGGK